MIEKKEILKRILETDPYQLVSMSMTNSEIYYVNDREFDELSKHLYGEPKYGIEIDSNGDIIQVENEKIDYDTIIINSGSYIFKRVKREDKLNRIV